MRAAKAIVVPSTWDVFNLGTVEAMALGKVVVVSSGAGAVDLLEDGVNGFVFPNLDSASLAEVVRRIERIKASDLVAIGRAAAATVRARLSPPRVAEERIALYRQLSTGKAANNPWLRDWLAPGSGGASLDFLDALPLHDLSRYAAHRTARKVLGIGRN